MHFFKGLEIASRDLAKGSEADLRIDLYRIELAKISLGTICRTLDFYVAGYTHIVITSYLPGIAVIALATYTVYYVGKELFVLGRSLTSKQR